MNPKSRRLIVTGVLVVLLALTLILPAFADDVEVAGAATPAVGMAYDASTDALWLAGPQADQGVFLEASEGREVSISADLVSVQALGWYGGRLWVGDIGDEQAQRDTVVVYRVGSTEGGRSTYHAYDFTYEDGPRDARAMLLSGRGNIYIVTSGEDPGIYRIRGEASRERVNTLVRVFDAPEGVTDGAFLNDGVTMALRTTAGIDYVDALEWEALATETLVGAPEGESLTVGPDDLLYIGGNPGVRTWQVVSESTTTTVEPGIPASPEATASPEGSESPGGTASPEATGEATQAPTVDETDEGPARAGTITALLLAALVAVGAGLVTFFWRN